MRVIVPVAVILCVAAGVFSQAQAPGSDASSILAAAREALGGEHKLAAVKTFTARGRTRQVRGNNLVPIEFEIACELPDRYVRRDEIPAQESGPTSTGFNGDGLIQLPPPEPPPQAATAGGPARGAMPAGAAPPAGAATATAGAAPPGGAAAATAGAAPPAGAAAATAGAAPPARPPDAATAAKPAAPSGPAGPPPAPPDPRKARVTTIKQDFVKLTLGMFAASFASYPLTFARAGQAEAPQGTADVIDVKGVGTFALKFFISSQTHLPIMVSWTMPATNIVLMAPGQPAPENLAPGSVVVQAPAPPGPTAAKEEQGKYAKDLQELRKKALAGAKPVEYRIYYSDYRDVGNGLKFPFRLRRAIAGETVEETNFDEFKVNARIDPRRFEALK
jgi:hypothetical protein